MVAAPVQESADAAPPDEGQEPRREPRRRSRGSRRPAQTQAPDAAEQLQAEPVPAHAGTPQRQHEPVTDAPSEVQPAADMPKPRSRRPRKPAVKQET